MSDTIREQILSAIEDRLATILSAAGYNTDVGADVYRAFLVPLEFDNIPAIGFLPGDETLVRHHGCMAEYDWQMTFQAVDQYGNELASVAGEKLYADVLESVFGIEYSLGYDSGGTQVIAVGDTIEGADSGAQAIVGGVSLDTGAWLDSDAAGSLSLRRLIGTFADNENLNIGVETNVATVDGSITGTGAVANLTDGLGESLNFISGGMQFPDSDQLTVGVSLIISIKYKSIIGNPYSQET